MFVKGFWRESIVYLFFCRAFYIYEMFMKDLYLSDKENQGNNDENKEMKKYIG